METPQGPVAVDTGFIVYNELNYPNLSALFRHLSVATDPTEMSFALSLENGAYEYAGSGLGGFFGQRTNLFKPRHWRLLRDVARFFDTAHDHVAHACDEMTLGAFLEQESYSRAFIEDHIVPMGAAIWSTSMNEMLDFPAPQLHRFLRQSRHAAVSRQTRLAHGFRRQPALCRKTGEGRRVRVSCRQWRGAYRPPSDYVHVADAQGVIRPFDHAVIATHADQALGMLDTPSALEENLLGSFSYQANRAVLHRDPRWMPRRRRLWSSWNYLKAHKGADTDLCVSYWMNRFSPCDQC